MNFWSSCVSRKNGTFISFLFISGKCFIPVATFRIHHTLIPLLLDSPFFKICSFLTTSHKLILMQVLFFYLYLFHQAFISPCALIFIYNLTYFILQSKFNDVPTPLI